MNAVNGVWVGADCARAVIMAAEHVGPMDRHLRDQRRLGDAHAQLPVLVWWYRMLGRGLPVTVLSVGRLLP